jgi:hypothetical protein
LIFYPRRAPSPGKAVAWVASDFGALDTVSREKIAEYIGGYIAAGGDQQ